MQTAPLIAGVMQMREGIRTVLAGTFLAFGIVWILASMLLLGCLVLASSEARGLARAGATAVAVAGGVLLIAGGAMVVAFVVSIVRGRYGIAVSGPVTSLLGVYVASRAPICSSARSGPVLTPEFAVGLAAVVVGAAIATAWAVHRVGRDRRVRHRVAPSRSVPPYPI